MLPVNGIFAPFQGHHCPYMAPVAPGAMAAIHQQPYRPDYSITAITHAKGDGQPATPIGGQGQIVSIKSQITLLYNFEQF